MISIEPDCEAPFEPHILTAIDTLERGGAQHHVLDLCRGLIDRGHRVTLLSSGDGPLLTEFADSGVSVAIASPTRVSRTASGQLTACLVRQSLTGRFNLIHAHLHGAAIGGAVASLRSGCPLVITRHSAETWQGERDRALSSWARDTARATVAVSREIALDVGGAGCRVQIIPNGVSLPAPTHISAEQLRVQLGIPPQAYVIGFVGRLVEEKDPLLFVETAAAIAARSPTAHFLMVGDGPLQSAVQQRVRRLGLERQFTLMGSVHRGSVPFSAIDVLLLTSRTEGSPLVVLEAMAASRPVVAPAVGDVPYQIKDGVTGYVVRARHSNALAGPVLALADGELRTRLGRTARARIARHFTLERMVSRTLALYRGSMETGNLRPRMAGAGPNSSRCARIGRHQEWGRTSIGCASGSQPCTTSIEPRRS